MSNGQEVGNEAVGEGDEVFGNRWLTDVIVWVVGSEEQIGNFNLEGVLPQKALHLIKDPFAMHYQWDPSTLCVSHDNKLNPL
jgi:hypothetical protein